MDSTKSRTPECLGVRTDRRGRALATGFALAVCWSSAAPASADGIRADQGGPSLGNAGAGAEATAEDASTSWFNPAGMARLSRPSFLVSQTYVDHDICFRNRDSRGGTGLTIQTLNGREGGEHAWRPGLFAVVPCGDEFSVGFSANEALGHESDFHDDTAARYFSTRTIIRSTDLGASVAWRPLPWLAFGAGLDAQELHVEFENAVDFGTLATRRLGADAAAAAGLVPHEDDGIERIEGSDLAFGWNVGVLFTVDDATRIGLTYRAPIVHGFDGDAEFDVPRDARAAGFGREFHDTDAEFGLVIPETAALGAVHDVRRDLSLLASVQWTRFSRVDTLHTRFDEPRKADEAERLDWRDTWRVAAGATWRASEDFAFRVGLAWDRAAVSARNRSLRLPDARRLSAAFGVSWRIAEATTLDFSYLHTWVDDADIHLVDRQKGTLDGSAFVSIEAVVSLSVTVAF